MAERKIKRLLRLKRGWFGLGGWVDLLDINQGKYCGLMKTKQEAVISKQQLPIVLQRPSCEINVRWTSNFLQCLVFTARPAKSTTRGQDNGRKRPSMVIEDDRTLIHRHVHARIEQMKPTKIRIDGFRIGEDAGFGPFAWQITSPIKLALSDSGLCTNIISGKFLFISVWFRERELQLCLALMLLGVGILWHLRWSRSD